MPKNIFTRDRSLPLNRTHKIAIAGVGALGAAAVALTAVPASGQTTTTSEAAPTAKVAYSTQQIQDVQAGVTGQLASASQKVAAIEAKQEAAAKKETAAKKAAAKKAAAKREAKQSTSRSAARTEVKKSYPNNLDGWIREARAIMKKHGIPGSYEGIHRNIMRESSGNPMAINDWDINAINGIPSKGLLQVIPPTFEAYHVAGTSKNIYDPVANIVAACNYAADKYGTMDNVDSAY
ncbi:MULTISPECIES: transglycosylase SLT domain-containing protein [Streptomyces]|uniref:transglycosylase SLT domain-containing protein n=1 Tax=Streptomyces TaxID=1883 RepID=UPI0007862454|nr:MULTISPECIES: transglycosylase SLT domain-containing protein [Streptomyces]WDI17675.1 transglycosylase SLT domain-containing protein [Streptomyces enissocaesilis]KYK11625.1 lytic transglycosylase [Streptomyces sp. CC71]MBQ0882888.1 transglycosylase SLT domain-containing protein [Streptomyces sp. RT42]MBU8548943.1 transglycosylase SLT domain-containing protein [Streptomyces sp. Osf17]MBU8555719.1 transglycosylase SLT domain-containing protein [Streptomyces sp. Babs14]